MAAGPRPDVVVVVVVVVPISAGLAEYAEDIVHAIQCAPTIGQHLFRLRLVHVGCFIGNHFELAQLLGQLLFPNLPKDRALFLGRLDVGTVQLHLWSRHRVAGRWQRTLPHASGCLLGSGSRCWSCCGIAPVLYYTVEHFSFDVCRCPLEFTHHLENPSLW